MYASPQNGSSPLSRPFLYTGEPAHITKFTTIYPLLRIYFVFTQFIRVWRSGAAKQTRAPSNQLSALFWVSDIAQPWLHTWPARFDNDISSLTTSYQARVPLRGEADSHTMASLSQDIEMETRSPPAIPEEGKYGGFTRFEIELEVCQLPSQHYSTSRLNLKPANTV